MELDELKKSWNALNEQLQKEPIADEQQIMLCIVLSHITFLLCRCLYFFHRSQIIFPTLYLLIFPTLLSVYFLILNYNGMSPTIQ